MIRHRTLSRKIVATALTLFVVMTGMAATGTAAHAAGTDIGRVDTEGTAGCNGELNLLQALDAAGSSFGTTVTAEVMSWSTQGSAASTGMRALQVWRPVDVAAHRWRLVFESAHEPMSFDGVRSFDIAEPFTMEPGDRIGLGQFGGLTGGCVASEGPGMEILFAATEPGSEYVLSSNGGNRTNIAAHLEPVDSDADGVPDTLDNCQAGANADQADADGDGAGDVCDADDTDGPQGDLDGDGTVNVDDSDDSDVCVPSTSGAPDADGDDVRDACDADDNDGAQGDLDGDSVVNGNDNCLTVANAEQADADDDQQGDLCEAVHARSITLDLTHVNVDRVRGLKLSGDLSVADSASQCVQGRQVILARFNESAQRWSRVGTAETSATGRFVYRTTDRKGEYRVRTKMSAVTYDGSTTSCSAIRTATIHRH